MSTLLTDIGFESDSDEVRVIRYAAEQSGLPVRDWVKAVISAHVDDLASYGQLDGWDDAPAG